MHHTEPPKNEDLKLGDTFIEFKGKDIGKLTKVTMVRSGYNYTYTHPNGEIHQKRSDGFYLKTSTGFIKVEPPHDDHITRCTIESNPYHLIGTNLVA